MKKAVVWLLCGVISSGVLAGIEPDPVKDCPTNLVCFSIKEAAQIDRRLVEYDRMKKMKKVFGWHATCGVGVGAIATAQFDIKAAPVGYCGVGFGF